MPEMPEVQTTLEGIRELEGATITGGHATDSNDRRIGPLGECAGKRVSELARRGKVILMRIEGGGGLSIHLGMTGRLTLTRGTIETAHLRAVLTTDRGQLSFTDPRRFGRVSVQAPGEEDPQVARMGPEVADDHAEALRGRLRNRKAPIKSLLLDQHIIAGIGNIYADETLWEARIHPETPAKDLEEPELERILEAADRILKEAVTKGGSSIRDYRKSDGSSGKMQEALKAYGRAGKPCLRCHTILQQSRVAGRGGSFCPVCQQARVTVAQKPGRAG